MSEQEALKDLRQATASELAGGVLGQLFDVLTSGDSELFTGRRHFFSWVAPGMPFQPEEWDFLQSTVGPTVADTARRVRAAASFATLVDFIPEVTGLGQGKDDAEKATTFFDARAGSLSAEYARALREAEVPNEQISAQALEDIAKIEAALWKTQTLSEGGFEITEKVPSLLLEQYHATRAAFELALLEQLTVAQAAEAQVSNEAIIKNQTQGGLLKAKTDFALQEWKTRGKRNFVEGLMARSARLMGETMADTIETLEAAIDPTRLPTDELLGTYFPAAVLPLTAIQITPWQTYTFDHNHYHHQRTKAKQSGKAGLSLPVLGGLFGGGGQGSKEEMKDTVDFEKFSLSFELVELPIHRFWFNESILLSDRWRLPDGAEPLSDGGDPPQGTMPAIPDRIVLARNIRMRFKDASTVVDRVESQFGGDAAMRFGLFSLGGKYDRTKQSLDVERDVVNQEILAPATQIVGYRCRFFPTVPDHDLGISNWITRGRDGGN